MNLSNKTDKSHLGSYKCASIIYYLPAAKRSFFCLFMALSKEQKQGIIKELKEKIACQKAMVFFDYSRLPAKDLFSLRESFKKEQNLLKVAKKTLIARALEEYSSSLAEKIKNLEGQLSIVFSFSDEFKPAKILYQFSKKNPKLKILGGFIDGQFQNPETIIALAQIPSKQELLARLTGVFTVILCGFLGCLKGNLSKLTYLFSQIKPEQAFDFKNNQKVK